MRLWFVGLALILAACSASREIVKPENEKPKSRYDESFDPLILDDHDLIILPEDAAGAEKQQNTSGQTQNSRVAEINGFRVQILATNNLEQASLVEQEAAERFRRDGFSTYLVFEAPLYKIRVGDCTERSQAEKIRDLAKSFGYEGAFIVKSMVVLPE